MEKRIYYTELINTIMGLKQSHHLPSASWRPRKARSENSENQGIGLSALAVSWRAHTLPSSAVCSV